MSPCAARSSTSRPHGDARLVFAVVRLSMPHSARALPVVPLSGLTTTPCVPGKSRWRAAPTARPGVSRNRATAAAASPSPTDPPAASASTSASAGPTTRPGANANNAPCDVVVLDGANLSWTFSASLYAKLGCKTKLPLSRGVTLALESSDLWDALGVNPVAFMPESYVEGPLHGLADGGTLETLIPRNVEYLGDGRWRNVVLHDLAQRGILTTVARPLGQRSADDREIIAFARQRNAMICSNDRYEDHIAGAGSSANGSKELRRWLDANRRGYEFSVGEPDDAAYRAGKPRVERPSVGATHLPPPPPVEAKIETDPNRSDVMDGWRADVHAAGSSRPWALGASRWGREGRGGRKGRGKRRRRHTLGNTGGGKRKGENTYRSGHSDSETDDLEFPFWALADEDLPVVFSLKKRKT